MLLTLNNLLITLLLHPILSKTQGGMSYCAESSSKSRALYFYSNSRESPETTHSQHGSSANRGTARPHFHTPAPTLFSWRHPNTRVPQFAAKRGFNGHYKHMGLSERKTPHAERGWLGAKTDPSRITLFLPAGRGRERWAGNTFASGVL